MSMNNPLNKNSEGYVPSTCMTCKKELDETVDGAGDCGGDCEECMIRAGDPDVGLHYLEETRRLRKLLRKISDKALAGAEKGEAA